MIYWFINEISLSGQYESVNSFVDELQEILKLRKFPWIREKLFFAATLKGRLVYGQMTFAELVYHLPHSDLRKSILQWLDKFGPFVEDHRFPEADDYFQYLDIEVTHGGLGEAARRIKASQLCSTFSFSHNNEEFTLPLLAVQHGLDDEPLAIIKVPNECDAKILLKKALDALAPHDSFQATVFHCRQRFDLLAIGERIEAYLDKVIFSHSASVRIVQLLSILQEFMEHRNDDGSVDQGGHEILKEHFRKEGCHFSDESDTNKSLFSQQMTFVDPLSASLNITCFWHGKIQTPQMRIHFEWPVPIGQRLLKIAYIGPKISKK